MAGKIAKLAPMVRLGNHTYRPRERVYREITRTMKTSQLEDQN